RADGNHCPIRLHYRLDLAFRASLAPGAGLCGVAAPAAARGGLMKFALSSLLFVVCFPSDAAAPQAVIDIRSFGAVPNDGVDHSAAFQAAFDALDREQGGTVICPPGAYEVWTPIVVRASAVRFAGLAGPSYNEDRPYSGCMLVARSDGMTLLQF